MARLELPEWAKPDLWLDDNNAVQFIRWKDDPKPYMANWFHAPGSQRRASDDRGWCMGGFQWRIPGPDYPTQNQGLWTLDAWEPLTLSPSLLCSCGAHGFIREGHWISA